MITRRELIAGATSALIVGVRRSVGATVAFDVPRGACDCHTHIVCTPGQYSLFSGRTYTAPAASVDMLLALHASLHIDRVVVVNVAQYGDDGTDNRCMVDALTQLGSRARGVALIGDQATDRELDALHAAGVRGIRINLETFGVTDPEEARRRFRRSVERLSGRPWHIQLNTRPSVIEVLEADIATSPVPVSLDHFGLGGTRLPNAVEQREYQAVLRLVHTGHAYVKISAAYRLSDPPAFREVAPLATALIAANPRRVIWGSDWPHPDSRPRPGRKNTDVSPPLAVDDAAVFGQLALWAPEPRVREMILVDNPARLYGF